MEENKHNIFNKKFFTMVLPALLVIWAVFYNDLLFGGSYFWEDQMNYFYPLRMFAASSFAEWGITFWNPYMFGGVPFIADVQTAYFYPTNLLFNIVYKVVGGFGYGGYQFFALFHMFLMSVFTYVAVRLQKGSVLKSIFFALFYTYAAFNTLHLIHFSFIQTTLLFPLIISLFAKYLEKPDRKIGLYLSLSVGISFLGGYAQYLYGLMIFLSLFWTYNVYTTKSYQEKKSLIKKATLLVYLGLGISLSFFQWIPTADFVKETTRKDMTLEDSQISSVSYSRAVNLVAPRFYGEISQDAKQGKAPYWWGSRVNYEYWETAMFFGVTPLLFFLFTLIGLSKKERLLAIGVTLFIIGLMLGEHFFLYKLFFNYFPGFSMFRNAGRYAFFLLLFVFSVLLFRSDSLMEEIEFKKLVIVGSVLSAIGFLFYIVTTYPNADVESFSLKQILIAIGFIAATVGALRLDPKKAKIMWMVLIAIVFIDLKLADSNFSSETLDPEIKHGVINPLKQFHSSEDEMFRIKSRTGRMMAWERNSGMVNGIELIEGYNPLMLNDFFQFWFQSGNKINAEMLNVKYALNTERRQFVRQNQWPRYFFTNELYKVNEYKDQLQNLTKQDAKRTFALVKEDIATVSSNTPSTQNIEKKLYTPNRQVFEVSTSSPSLFVLNEIYFKNFKAKLNGEDCEIIKANGIHRAVVIPDGKHTLEFYYDRTIFYVGFAASFVGFVLLLLLCKKQDYFIKEDA